MTAADMAAALGVGLIEMTGSDTTKNPRISELLPAPAGTPIERFRLEVVEKLGYSTCTICHSMFKRGDSRFREFVETTVPKATSSGKGLIYWLNEVDARGPSSSRASRTSQTSIDQVYARRYVCPDCVSAVFGELV